MPDTFYKLWEKQQVDRGVDIATVRARIKALKIETPSWGYGDSGTRFKVFKKKGAATSLLQKLDDAAQVHKFTGVCPTVAIHIPWDTVDDWSGLKKEASDRGLAIGAVNPNLFQDEEYMLGSLCHADKAIRARAIAHMLECVEIMKKTGSRDLSLWLADGTNYPGQGDFRARKRWLEEALKATTDALPDAARLLIEYKVFEPAFYHTDLCDWGIAYLEACRFGDKAQVLVDLGHHSPGVNVEHIVAILLDEGKLGGFHFNNRKYADDDLIVGAIQPYELYLIFREIVNAEDDPCTVKCARNIAYMIDQSHCIEPKVPAMIRSVMNIQSAHAKALLVNRSALAKAQAAGDVLAAEAVVRGAYETDVRPLLESVREEMGISGDPMAAYLATDYEAKKVDRPSEGKGWA